MKKAFPTPQNLLPDSRGSTFIGTVGFLFVQNQLDSTLQRTSVAGYMEGAVERARPGL